MCVWFCVKLICCGHESWQVSQVMSEECLVLYAAIELLKFLVEIVVFLQQIAGARCGEIEWKTF